MPMQEWRETGFKRVRWEDGTVSQVVEKTLFENGSKIKDGYYLNGKPINIETDGTAEDFDNERKGRLID
ncbi:MAG: hypothetical protein ACJ8C4_18570 [Gemmataceae bacterium]